MEGDKKESGANETSAVSDLDRRRYALDYLVELLYCRDSFDEIDLNDPMCYDGAYPEASAKTNATDVKVMLYDVIIDGIEAQRDGIRHEIYQAERKKRKAGASREKPEQEKE